MRCRYKITKYFFLFSLKITLNRKFLTDHTMRCTITQRIEDYSDDALLLLSRIKYFKTYNCDKFSGRFTPAYYVMISVTRVSRTFAKAEAKRSERRC